MTARILDGAALARTLTDEVRADVTALVLRGTRPGLGVLLVGDHAASAVYVKSKTRSCEELGLHHETRRLPASATTAEVAAVVEEYNARSDIHGILVQLPLPPQVDAERVLDLVDPRKDVDGFHPDNVGRLVPKRTRTRAAGESTTMTVSQSLLDQAFREKAVVQMDPQVKLSESMQRLSLRSAVAVPLLDESRAVGVIYADTSSLTAAFDPFGIALLSSLASHTAIALEQTRLLRKSLQEERWRAKLAQYLAPGVVDRILASGENTPGFAMNAEEVEVTVLFCDMAGFTSRTENMEPHDVLVLLNRCFSQMTETVQDEGGTVDKYIGDCLMAVFGAPFAQPDHARRAARAALGLRDAIARINSEGTDVQVGFRIGMNSGRAVAGDVGHVARRNWTVLGSTVNLASRMESSVAQPGQIVLTGQTRSAIGDEFEVRLIEGVKAPKGITRGFQAFELVGLRK